MWFRRTRSHHDLRSRSGVAAAARRSRDHGPGVVETLEDRALMSMMGQAHPMIRRPQTSFVQTNLVSDLASNHPVTVDQNLMNPWGLVASATSPWWISDNHAGVSTLYNGNTGAKIPLTVTIPSPSAPTGGSPTGIVSNSSTADFLVSGPGTAAHFIFATEDGTIAAWNSGSKAVIKVDNSSVPTAANGAVYKGLAMGSINSANYLYAANFRAGTVDVFDSSFHQVSLGSGAVSGKFKDSHIPRGFAPFGIANINGDLFVTYAKQDSAKHDDAKGPGRGFVDEFDTSGHLIQRIAARGMLNSPWGLAVAPSSFGHFSGDLLVGNFGDGRINALKPTGHGQFRSDGQLRDPQGKPITIDGLWGLAVGNGGMAGPSSTLFFTAGINGEQDGLFGTLTAST
jgi:uncharacterized protein (TIGR03118 family)